MKYITSLRFPISNRALRSRLLLSACLALGWSALNWAGGSETDLGPKVAGPPTGGLLPPAEQRFFDKSALAQPAAMPSGVKTMPAGQVSGALPPGQLKAYNKSVASPEAMPARSAANPASVPVSGQASPEELRGSQKPGGNSTGPSVLVSPVSGLPPGARKVAVGTVFGPASPEDLWGYVKPAALPEVAPEPARAPTSGTLPAAEIKQVQK